LAVALIAVKGHAAPETGHAYIRARGLWVQLGSPSEFLQVPHGLARYHAHRGEIDLALRLDEDLLRLNGQRNHSAGLVLAHQSLGRNLMFAGRFASSDRIWKRRLRFMIPSHTARLSIKSGSPRRHNKLNWG